MLGLLTKAHTSALVAIDYCLALLGQAITVLSALGLWLGLQFVALGLLALCAHYSAGCLGHCLVWVNAKPFLVSQLGFNPCWLRVACCWHR